MINVKKDGSVTTITESKGGLHQGQKYLRLAAWGEIALTPSSPEPIGKGYTTQDFLDMINEVLKDRIDDKTMHLESFYANFNACVMHMENADIHGTVDGVAKVRSFAPDANFYEHPDQHDASMFPDLFADGKLIAEKCPVNPYNNNFDRPRVLISAPNITTRAQSASAGFGMDSGAYYGSEEAGTKAIYTEPDHRLKELPVTARSIYFFVSSSWTGSARRVIRSLKFYLNGVNIPWTPEWVTIATNTSDQGHDSDTGPYHNPANPFMDNALSGPIPGTTWATIVAGTQTLAVEIPSGITFDEIRYNNGNTDAVKGIAIYASMDALQPLPVDPAAIPNQFRLFEGELADHRSSDAEDTRTVPIFPEILSNTIVGKYPVIGPGMGHVTLIGTDDPEESDVAMNVFVDHDRPKHVRMLRDERIPLHILSSVVAEHFQEPVAGGARPSEMICHNIPAHATAWGASPVYKGFWRYPRRVSFGGLTPAAYTYPALTGIATSGPTIGTVSGVNAPGKRYQSFTFVSDERSSELIEAAVVVIELFAQRKNGSGAVGTVEYDDWRRVEAIEFYRQGTKISVSRGTSSEARLIGWKCTGGDAVEMTVAGSPLTVTRYKRLANLVALPKFPPIGGNVVDHYLHYEGFVHHAPQYVSNSPSHVSGAVGGCRLILQFEQPIEFDEVRIINYDGEWCQDMLTPYGETFPATYDHSFESVRGIYASPVVSDFDGISTTYNNADIKQHLIRGETAIVPMSDTDFAYGSPHGARKPQSFKLGDYHAFRQATGLQSSCGVLPETRRVGTAWANLTKKVSGKLLFAISSSFVSNADVQISRKRETQTRGRAFTFRTANGTLRTISTDAVRNANVPSVLDDPGDGTLRMFIGDPSLPKDDGDRPMNPMGLGYTLDLWSGAESVANISPDVMGIKGSTAVVTRAAGSPVTAFDVGIGKPRLLITLTDDRTVNPTRAQQAQLIKFTNLKTGESFYPAVPRNELTDDLLSNTALLYGSLTNRYTFEDSSWALLDIRDIVGSNNILTAFGSSASTYPESSKTVVSRHNDVNAKGLRLSKQVKRLPTRDPLGTNGSVVIHAWMMFHRISDPSGQVVLSTVDNFDDDYAHALFELELVNSQFDPGLVLRAYANGGVQQTISAQDIKLETWMHVYFYITPAGMGLYVDGRLCESLTFSPALQFNAKSIDATYIGGPGWVSVNDMSGNMEGVIDDLMVHASPLSVEQIAYFSEMTPDPITPAITDSTVVAGTLTVPAVTHDTTFVVFGEDVIEESAEIIDINGSLKPMVGSFQTGVTDEGLDMKFFNDNSDLDFNTAPLSLGWHVLYRHASGDLASTPVTNSSSVQLVEGIPVAGIRKGKLKDVVRAKTITFRFKSIWDNAPAEPYVYIRDIGFYYKGLRIPYSESWVCKASSVYSEDPLTGRHAPFRAFKPLQLSGDDDYNGWASAPAYDQLLSVSIPDGIVFDEIRYHNGHSNGGSVMQGAKDVEIYSSIDAHDLIADVGDIPSAWKIYDGQFFPHSSMNGGDEKSIDLLLDQTTIGINAVMPYPENAVYESPTIHGSISNRYLKFENPFLTDQVDIRLMAAFVDEPTVWREVPKQIVVATDGTPVGDDFGATVGATLTEIYCQLLGNNVLIGAHGSRTEQEALFKVIVTPNT